MQEVMPGIIVDPLIKGGKPVIKGTRVPVELIVGKLAGGLTYEEIMAEYDLKKEDILAALRYAANILVEEQILLRIPNEFTITQTNELLLSSLRILREVDIVGNIVVIEPRKIRIRKRRIKTS